MPKRFAIAGTRGIPANYGGFETFAEELSTRLAARGHRVTVYCRHRHPEPAYRGVNLVYLPTIHHKYFDTIAHTFVSTLHLMLNRQDAILYCNAANAIFTIVPRVLGMPVALNVDGLERKRKKWNALARSWYLISEWLSTKLPTHIVTDAVKIKEYYWDRYGAESTFISYGAELGKLPTHRVLDELCLEPGKYFLYVSRLEPENNALLVREAFEKVDTDFKLAIIGDAPYADEYKRRIHDTRDPRIVIPGGIYGEGYRELQSHSFAYVHATEVGGTHPALIEAMGRGALTLFLETVENSEVAGGAGIAFENNRDSLAAAMTSVLKMKESERQEWRELATDRVRKRYSWDAVTDAYEKLLVELAGD